MFATAPRPRRAAGRNPTPGPLAIRGTGSPHVGGRVAEISGLPGRAGRLMFFLRAGHDVFVTDAMERGRAGWARSLELLAGQPVFRTMGEGLGLFRSGPGDGWNLDPAQRRAHANPRFPVACWNQFMMQPVPRRVTTDRQVRAADDAPAR